METLRQEDIIRWSTSFVENIIVREIENTSNGYSMWIKINLVLDVETEEGLMFISNLLVDKIQNMIEISKSTSDPFVLNLIVNTNILNSINLIQRFFQYFSLHIPIDNISEINVFSLPKYIGIANVLLSFSTKEVRKKMQILSISSMDLQNKLSL